jgi:hypothetical protein
MIPSLPPSTNRHSLPRNTFWWAMVTLNFCFDPPEANSGMMVGLFWGWWSPPVGRRDPPEGSPAWVPLPVCSGSMFSLIFIAKNYIAAGISGPFGLCCLRPLTVESWWGLLLSSTVRLLKKSVDHPDFCCRRQQQNNQEASAVRNTVICPSIHTCYTSGAGSPRISPPFFILYQNLPSLLGNGI